MTKRQLRPEELHPTYCNGLARCHAYFGALAFAETIGRSDAHEYAQSVRDIIPACNCKTAAEDSPIRSVTYTVTVGESDDSQLGPTPLT